MVRKHNFGTNDTRQPKSPRNIMINYSLFVIFHRALHEEIYKNKENFYSFAKVGNFPPEVNSESIKNRIVYANELPGFTEKGAHWAESEFIFALYKTLKENPNYITSDYIGFTQYDHTTTEKNTGEDIIDYLNSFTKDIFNENVISLVPIKTSYEIGQKISMDFSNLEKQIGDPLCYFRMIKNYNDYYNTKFVFSDFYHLCGEDIPLCSSFIMSKENFMEMMNFCSWASERDNLDQFDPNRKWRAAGGFMERYYATWIILSKKKIINFQIDCLSKF